MLSTLLSVLRHFSSNYDLEFILPTIAIVLVLGFVILGRKSIVHWLGDRKTKFARGFLMALLFLTAVMSVENYRATDYYRYNSYLNAYEFYHYYIGSKYAHEVGYIHMYAASLVADQETGMKWKDKSGTLRDLATGGRVDHKRILADAAKYKAMFTPERWEEFKKDIAWFKSKLVESRWNGILRDKGYNGTPVWTMLVGGLLSNTISTDSEAGMMFLALLDPLLILIAFGMVVWAFGPRTAFLMIILLGTNYMMKWWHMKGAYLRTDWAMCLVMSVCLIKKEKYASAGVLTAYAALSRIFPAVMLFGMGARLFWSITDLCLKELRQFYVRLEMDKRPRQARISMRASIALFIIILAFGSYGLLTAVAVPWIASEEHRIGAFFDILKTAPQGFSVLLLLFTLLAWTVIGLFMGATALKGFWRGTLSRRYLWFFLAAGITIVGLWGASQFYWRGTDYWDQYTNKIARHNNDISTWRVGYKYVFMANFGEDFNFLEKPIREWQPRVQSAVWFAENGAAWWRTQMWILVFALLAAVRLKDYRAHILGFAPMFFLASPTYYYYIMLLVPLLFFAPRAAHGPYSIGLALMYITGMSGFAFYGMWQQNYGTYYWLSVQVMLMVLYMLFLAYGESLLSLIKDRAKPAPAPENASQPADAAT